MNFVESKNIKFYPTGYRGNIKIGNDSYSFDPESKLNTEENTRRAYNTLVTFKDVDQNKHDGDVVISKDYTYNEPPQQGNYQFHNFEFIISGYYVKILDADKAFYNIITTNASGKSIYAEIKIVNRGFDEQTEKNETNPVLDENNTAIICRSVISLKPANTSGQSQSTTDDSTEGNENSNLDIDGEFTGINFIINDSNHIDETTITDKNIHIFKILEKIDNEWKVPNSAKLISNLKDIYADGKDSNGNPVDASKKLYTDELNSKKVDSDEITSRKLDSEEINNLYINEAKDVNQNFIGFGIRNFTNSTEQPTSMVITQPFVVGSGLKKKTGKIQICTATGKDNNFTIISNNATDNEAVLSLVGNYHELQTGYYGSSRTPGDEWVKVGGNYGAVEDKQKIYVVTRDTDQIITADKYFGTYSMNTPQLTLYGDGSGIRIKRDHAYEELENYNDKISNKKLDINSWEYSLESNHNLYKEAESSCEPETHLGSWKNIINISDRNDICKKYKSPLISLKQIREGDNNNYVSSELEADKILIKYKNNSDESYSEITNNSIYTTGEVKARTFKTTGGTGIISIDSGGIIEGHKFRTKDSLGASDIGFETKGEVKAGNFYATSDRRLKDHIETIDYNKSILDLPVYTYTYKDSDKKQIGCMAQDLQKLYPELVSQDENGYLSVDNSKVVYLLLEEVKLLKKEIEDLKKSK